MVRDAPHPAEKTTKMNTVVMKVGLRPNISLSLAQTIMKAFNRIRWDVPIYKYNGDYRYRIINIR